MDTATALPSEAAAVVEQIDPGSQSTGTVTTGWVAAADFIAFLALIAVGTLGASGTVDAKLEQAQDGSGTNSKDVTGAAITQLTKAGSDDNKQALINLRPEQLDVSGGYTHFRLSVTAGTAASDVAASVLGFDARQGPASDQQASTVAQTVTAG